MLKIFKYTLKMKDIETIAMQKDAMILDCQQQNQGFLTIWAIVNPDAELENRTFEIIGTGNVVSEQPREFIATVQTGLYVWHIFEINNP